MDGMLYLLLRVCSFSSTSSAAWSDDYARKRACLPPSCSAICLFPYVDVQYFSGYSCYQQVIWGYRCDFREWQRVLKPCVLCCAASETVFLLADIGILIAISVDITLMSG